MPFLWNKNTNPQQLPWPCAPLPEKIEDESTYWVIPCTNEVITSFEEFFKRTELYREKTWGCRLSGKKGFTFEEALNSEREISQILSKFPTPHLRILVEMLHGSTEMFDSISAKITKRLQNIHFPGEVARWKGKVVDVLQRNGGEEDDIVLYEIEKKTQKKGSERLVVPGSQLVRSDIPMTSYHVRCKIRDVATRSSEGHKPWIVYSDVAESLQISLPPIDFSSKGKLDTPKRKRSVSANDVTKASKKLKENPTEEDIEKIRKKKKEKLERKYRKHLEMLLPLDDLKLLYLEGSKKPNFPIPSPFDYAISADIFIDVLFTWRFCLYFSKPLNLFPYSLEDFCKALVYPEPIELVVETVKSLLSVIGLSRKKMAPYNWEVCLRKYFRKSIEAEERHRNPSPASSPESNHNSDENESIAEEDSTVVFHEALPFRSTSQISIISERKEIFETLSSTSWSVLSLEERVRILRFLCEDSLAFYSVSESNSAIRYIVGGHRFSFVFVVSQNSI